MGNHEDELDRFLAERAWLFELSLDPMVVGRFDGYLRVVNGAFQRLVDRQLDELLVLPFMRLVHPDDRQQAEAAFARLAGGESLRDYPVRMSRGDGDHRWIAWTVTPSPAEEAFYAVGRDITERRRVDEQLAAQAQELARSNADLEEFASVVSHDLAQPLRVICSYAELLTGSYGAPLSAEARGFVERIQTGGRQMQYLTRDLLAYCRVGQGRLRLETVDCNRLVADVLSTLAPMLGCTEVAVAGLPLVEADPTQLGQVFQNLIANAVTYARHGVPACITVEGQQRRGRFQFAVSDNGIGIPPEQRERIFEMFERVERVSDDVGTGIGLAICARVIGRHGGQIWVEDGPGGGSRFCFTLPVP